MCGTWFIRCRNDDDHYMNIFVCYLIRLFTTVGHFLDGHHLVIAHISGLLDNRNNNLLCFLKLI